MRKIYLSIGLIVLSMLIFHSKINADTFQCEYTFGDLGENWIIEYDTDNGTFKNLNEKQNKNNALSASYHYNYNYEFLPNEIKTYVVNECPILHMAYNYQSFNAPILIK